MQQSILSHSEEVEAVKNLLIETRFELLQLDKKAKKEIHKVSEITSESLKSIAYDKYKEMIDLETERIEKGILSTSRQAVLALDDDVPEKKELLASSYSHEARLKYFLQENPALWLKALHCINEANRLCPNPDYYSIEAKIYADLNSGEKAIQSLKKAVALGGSTKEEMETELAEMKDRFGLQDYQSTNTSQQAVSRSTPVTSTTTVTPKEQAELLSELLLKRCAIGCIAGLLLATIFDLFHAKTIAMVFMFIFQISFLGLLAGVFFWVRKFFLKD